MKKGMFFSLTVVIFLVILFVVFKNKAEAAQIKEETFMDRAQINVMNHFVDDFEGRYVLEMLESSSKLALVKRSESGSFPKSEIADIMDDGYSGGIKYLDSKKTTGEFFSQVLETLTFPLDKKTFTYALTNVVQTSPSIIHLEFSVNYEFEVGKKNWKKTNMPVEFDLEVYTMYHPTYSAYIDRSWLVDSSGTCYANQIISDASSCSGQNLVPTWYIPPPILPPSGP